MSEPLFPGLSLSPPQQPAPTFPETSDLEDALQEMRKARPAYDKAEQYDEGPVDEVFVAPKLRWVMRESGINFQEIMGGTVIDAVSNRLTITSVQPAEENQAVDEALSAFDKANLMTLVRPQLVRNTLKFGDYYLFAWQTETGVRVIPVDPRQARLLYGDDDPTLPSLGIRRWVLKNRHVRVDLAYRDHIESYISAGPNPNATQNTEFVPYQVPGNDSHIVEHQFGRPPLFHFSTGLPGEYGTPEHRGFYATQDILLKLALGHMAAVDYTAIPQRYAIMAADYDTSEAEDQDAAQYYYDQPVPTPRVREREALSNLRANPGSLWYQRGVTAFGQFDPADPAAFISPATHHLQIGATITSTPLHFFEGMAGGSLPSGESLKVAMEPLIAKCRDRQATFDHGMRDFYGSILTVLGFAGAEVVLRWAPVEPTNESETWSVARDKQAAGVPVDVTLSEAGYDEDTVDQWQRENAAGLPERLAQLVQVGEFLASSATAVAAGAIDAARVDEILSTIIGPLGTVDGVDSDDANATAG